MTSQRQRRREAERRERRKALRSELGRVLAAISTRQIPRMRPLTYGDGVAWFALIGLALWLLALTH